MKRILVSLMISSAMLFVSPTMIMADSPSVKKGQKLFKKKFRKTCKFSGVRFARHHTQAEWEMIYDDGEFPNEAKRICPKLQLNKIKKSWWKNIYDFSYLYAKDGKIPKC